MGFPGFQAEPWEDAGSGHPPCQLSITNHGHSCALVPQSFCLVPDFSRFLKTLQPTTLLSTAMLVCTELYLNLQKEA